MTRRLVRPTGLLAQNATLKTERDNARATLARIKAVVDDWDEFPDDELGVDEAVAAIRQVMEGDS